MNWLFSHVPGIGRGINDAGVTHFAASGDTALFREWHPEFPGCHYIFRLQCSCANSSCRSTDQPD